MRNRQPGKALPYFLRLRDPQAFVLVRDYNLFTDIQDQALELLDFDEELRREGREKERPEHSSPHGIAVDLLVEHTHSIPVRALSKLHIDQLLIVIVTTLRYRV